MLIQRGKTEGWLHLDARAVKAWAVASGINFTNASPAVIPGRGLGLLADTHLNSPLDGPPCQILDLPEDLVLSVEAVKKHASFDRDFRQVLESLGEFGQTPRGAILTFLLFQASLSCPHLPERLGVHGPFTDYVKSLPCELLPTFWRPEELQLLIGTTLAPAIASKLKSLQREYDLLCTSAKDTRWFKAMQSLLDFDDWLQVDAMFRSRALDFHGSCMIPGMDLASHAAGEQTNAFYDRHEGSYFLRLIEGKSLQGGQEVTITYGDEKGACEMLFSYGFIDEQMESAETLFLGLDIPDNDASRIAKMKFANCAPGFKLIDVSENEGARTDHSVEDSTVTTGDDNSDTETGSGAVDWSGDFVWLLCVGLDDGLQFELARTVDGQDEELGATFNGQELKLGAGDLRRVLAKSELWPVYRLRAIVILQQRVFDQLQLLYSSQDQVEAVPHGDATDVRQRPHELILKLRELEFELLDKAYEDFEKQKLELAETPVVQEYLARMNSGSSQGGQFEEDFS